MTDWVAWHEEYSDPESRLSRRLREVHRELAEVLDRAPAGPLNVISACAGQGRDIIEVVAQHRRLGDVTARLVEFDPELAAQADSNAKAAGLDKFEVVRGDASTTDAYAGMTPVNVAVFCGIFGNITDEDIHQTIRTLPALLAANGEVTWTRHTNEPDITPQIRAWFADSGFEEMASSQWDADGFGFGVGTHRLTTTPASFEAGVTMFRFLR